MTDPLLNYQTPARQSYGAWCTAAWISILTLGILLCAGGICLGALLALLYSHLALRFANPQILAFAIVTIVAILEFSGALYITSALHLRRGSRTAALVAAIVGTFDAAGSLLVVCLCLVNLVKHAPTAVSALGSMTLYSVLLLVNASVVYLAFRARSQIPCPPP